MVDQELCIGAASCVALAAKTFGLNQEGKVFVLNEAPDSMKGAMDDVISSTVTNAMDIRDTIMEAARSCPVLAIALFEDDGSTIVL
jgi:ferredoxin